MLFKTISIQTKFTIVLWVVMTMVVVVLTLFQIYAYKRDYMESIDKQLEIAAEMAKSIVGTDYHNNIIDSHSVSEADYLNTVKKFNQICTELEFQYLWSNLFLEDGRIVFTTGTSTSKDIKQGDHAMFFDAHSDPSAFNLVNKTKKPTYSTFENKWGAGRMLLIPYQDNKDRTYVFGASKSISSLDEHIKNITYYGFLELVILFLLGYVISFLLARAIVTPIKKMSRLTSDIASGKYSNVELDLKGSAEVVSLSNSINLMSKAIQDRTSELSARENELQAVIENIPNMVFVKDVENLIFRRINRAGEKLLGIPRDQILGKTDYELFDQKQAELFIRSDQKALESNFPIEIQKEYIKTDAGMRILYTRKAVIQDENGNPEYILGVSEDITERKQTEALLMQSSKMASLGEMATGVAHELNQPLNIIRMASANVMRRINKSSLDEEYLCNKLERIEEQTQRAASIIDHMRMFSRQPKHIKTRLDPGEIVHSVLGLIGEQLHLANIEIKLELAESCPLIEGEQIQIEQVLLNLLTNARDVLKPRQVGEDKRILIKVDAKDAGQVSIIVEDTGGGINENIIDRVFEPFFTTKEVGQGTGLGLSISYGIVSEMGGSMSVLNTDLGARFIVKLPVADKKE